MTQTFSKHPVIILAGGDSKRFKDSSTPSVHKAMLPFGRDDEKPWILYHVDCLLQLGMHEILLVVHKDIFHSLDQIIFRDYRHKAVSLAKNYRPDLGPFHSIKIGLGRLQSTSVFLLPVDMPPPKATTLRTMQQKSSGSDVVLPQFNGKSGHPIFIKQPFIKQLNSVAINDPFARLDIQIKKWNPQKVCKVKCNDSHIIKNFNTYEDYATWHNALANDCEKYSHRL